MPRPNPAQPNNWIDRAIELVSPAAAVRRYEARSRIDLARNSYRGAIRTRTSTPWSTSVSFRGGTANQRADLGDMRDRGRHAYDENPIARSLLDTETDNIVSEGFALQMRSSSQTFNKYTQARFGDWLDRADVAGRTGQELFRDSWREPRKDGDGGIALLKVGGRPRLQYVPGDLLINPRTRYDYRTMFNGVECDFSGRPLRFWVRDVDQGGTDTVSAVDARDFVYICHRNDPLAVRGMTVYAQIFEKLDQLDAYSEAVTIAARMACIFGIIRKTRSPSTFLNGLRTAENGDGEQQKAITLENGQLAVHGTDEEMYQITAQQPMSQTPDFIRALFRICALRFDAPIEIAAKDLSQVNFSGGRIGLISYYRSCRVKQDWLKSVAWNRIVYWWLSVERQRQQLGFPDAFTEAFPDDYGKFELHGREWDYNDPVREAQGDLLEISMGIKSEQQACAQRGRDWDETQTQRREELERKAKDRLPIVLSSLTRDANPAGPAAAQSPPPPPDAAAAEAATGTDVTQQN